MSGNTQKHLAREEWIGIEQQELYRYYSTQRPVDIGTYPKDPDNPLTGFLNYDERKVTLEDLLNCLEDSDMAGPSEAQPVSGESALPAEEKPHAGPPLSVQVQAQTADGGKQEPPPTKATRPTNRKKPLHKKRLAMAR